MERKYLKQWNFDGKRQDYFTCGNVKNVINVKKCLIKLRRSSCIMVRCVFVPFAYSEVLDQHMRSYILIKAFSIRLRNDWILYITKTRLFKYIENFTIKN